MGGSCKTSIVATVSSALGCYGETLSTLKFAQRAKLIKNEAIVNEDATGSHFALKQEVKRLSDELALLKAGGTVVVKDAESDEQRLERYARRMAYLKN